MTGAGTTNVNGGATLNGTDKDINGGRVVNLNSNTSWTAGSIRFINSNSTLANGVNQTFTATFDGLMYADSNPGKLFSNAGTFTKSDGTGTLTIQVPFANTATGTVNINKGTLLPADIFTNAGTVNIASGAALQSGGGINFNAGTILAGSGTLALTSGTININTPLTIPATIQVNLTSCAVHGTSALTIEGPLNWSSGGSMNGTGTTNVNGGATLNGTDKDINGGRVVNLNSNTSWTAGPIRFNNGGTLANSAGGTFTANPSTDTLMYVFSGACLFSNAGTFTKTGGTSTLYILPPMTNTGTVNANAGTIRFDSTYTQTAGALVLNGGSVDCGSFAVRGGKIQGGGTITGGVTSSGGSVIIEPGIGTASTGILAITGDLTLTSGSKLAFHLKGTTPGTGHDQLTEGGSTALSLTGVTLEVTLPGTYFPAPTDTFIVVDSHATPTGAFANVANGARMASTDGFTTFKVSYGGSSAFADKTQVILSEFQSSPSSLTLDDNQIAENAPLGTAVGLLAATDPNPAETFTYTLVSGTGSSGNAQFQISGNQLQAKAGIDYEVQTSYSIRVRVTNSTGGTLEQVFTIEVQDQGVTSFSLAPASILEQQPAGATVGTLSATVFPASSVTYTLVTGTGSTHNAQFSLTGSTLKTAAVLDYNLGTTRSIRLRATDASGEFLEQAVVVNVSLINDAPTLGVISNRTVAEDAPLQTFLIGGITSGSAVEVQALTVTATSSNPTLIPNPAITYTSPGATANLSFTPQPYTHGSATITVTVTDDGGTANGGIDTFSRTFTITVTPDPARDPNNRLQITRIGNGVRLTLTGLPGRTYGIMRTTDFVIWTQISTPAADASGNLLHDDLAPPSPRASYRVVSPAE